MSWSIEFLKEAENDLNKLDNSVKRQVLKGIRKVSQNPLPQNEGGFGKPLGNKSGTNLTNFFKIKFSGIGIRVVYKLIRTETTMIVVIISVREDSKVYKEATKRIGKHQL